MLFCHATPRNDEEIYTRISPEESWRAALDGVDADVVVCGHTHVQFDRRIGDVRSGRTPAASACRTSVSQARTGRCSTAPTSSCAARYAPGDLSAWPGELAGCVARGGDGALREDRRVSEPDAVVIGRVGKSHGLDGSFVVEGASETRELFATGRSCWSTATQATVVGVEAGPVGGPVIRLDRRVERGATLTCRAARSRRRRRTSTTCSSSSGWRRRGGGRPACSGAVTDVAPGVANDVLELDSGLALPMVEECVRSVDLDAGRIVVRPVSRATANLSLSFLCSSTSSLSFRTRTRGSRSSVRSRRCSAPNSTCGSFRTATRRRCVPAQVDDEPYGGGAGMVLRVDVVAAALDAVYGATPEHRVVALRRRGDS